MRVPDPKGHNYCTVCFSIVSALLIRIVITEHAEQCVSNPVSTYERARHEWFESLDSMFHIDDMFKQVVYGIVRLRSRSRVVLARPSQSRHTGAAGCKHPGRWVCCHRHTPSRITGGGTSRSMLKQCPLFDASVEHVFLVHLDII